MHCALCQLVHPRLFSRAHEFLVGLNRAPIESVMAVSESLCRAGRVPLSTSTGGRL